MQYNLYLQMPQVQLQGEMEQAMRHSRALSREEQEMEAMLDFLQGMETPTDINLLGALNIGEQL